jgi:hypothetical protein
MILATRIPHLTDQMLANTLRAAEASAQEVDWLMLAEIEHLERRLLPLLRRLNLDEGTTIIGPAGSTEFNGFAMHGVIDVVN